MLESLKVKNVALIDESEVTFGEGLNILTGETGAGKSILIDSINLALGAKADSSLIRQGAEYAYVELCFQVNNASVIQKLKELEVFPDEEGRVLLQRRIMTGKSSCRLNGESATGKLLQQVAAVLIDVHGQHEHQSLLNEKKHLEVLDAFCGDKLQAVKQELGAAYAAYREKEKLVKEALDEDGSKDREIALARFELEEIEAAALIEGEDEKLEADFRRMENSRQIGESLSQADACLNSYEQENARDLIGAAAKCVSDAAKYDASLAPCVESFAQVQELLQDIGRSLGHYIESMEFDAQTYTDTKERLDTINKCKTKYGNTISEILAYAQSQQEFLHKYDDFEQYKIKLQEELAQQKETLLALCQKASKIRCKEAAKLEKEMKELGLTEVVLDDKCYLYGKLPATEGKKEIPALGFIAHMDTVSDFCDHEIRPMVTENYDGGDLVLGTSGLVLSPKEFPHLTGLKGRTLLTSDGTTILGADDKAGIAEILTMIERIQTENRPHGTICVAFTPDEEIGMGAEHFNLDQFGAEYAYTLDGDSEGEIQYENFNACKAEFEIRGFNVHPGEGKDTMINASLVAIEINNCLPSMETPRGTEDYEGFYHLISMQGEVGEAKLNYIVRDHDKNGFEERKKTLRLIEKNLNAKWGEGTVTLKITDQYLNMKEIVEEHMHLIDHAKKACEAAGVAPLILPIRGGTDGCQLSFKGLPCPNLGTGGHAFHGPYEHISVEGMEKSVELLLALIQEYTK